MFVGANFTILLAALQYDPYKLIFDKIGWDNSNPVATDWQKRRYRDDGEQSGEL